MNHRMYVIRDIISDTCSPIFYAQNNVVAYNQLTASIEASKQKNPSLCADDFSLIFVGTIRDDGFITPDYHIVTKKEYDKTLRSVKESNAENVARVREEFKKANAERIKNDEKKEKFKKT